MTGLVAIATLAGLSGQAQAAQIDYNNTGNLPSIEKPVFNTYTNVPNGVANEADFVRIRPSTGDPTDNGTNGAKNMLYINKLAVPCAVGAKYDVRTYIHNGADADFNNNGTGSAVAKGVKLTMTAPLGQNGTTFKFSSTISASNAASVSDDATLLCDNNVRLKLIPQTVKIYTKTLGYNTLADSAANGTTSIGSNVLGSGDVWGCWDSRVIVVYAVEVIEAEKPVSSCDLLKVALIGERKYRYSVDATATNSLVIDEYQFDFGDGTPILKSTSKTVEHTYTKAGTFNVAVSVWMSLNGDKIKGGVATSDKCKAVINEPDTPIYTCDSFILTFVKDRTYKYEVKATAKGGATIKGYEYDFADGSAVLSTDKASVEHSYTKDGKFAPKVTVIVEVNGETKRVSGENCMKSLTVDTKVPMCELPGKGHLPKNSPECKVAGVTTTAKTLPATGAGSIAGIMAAVTAAGSVAHRRFTLRRNR